ncbi:relaxase/mobilization nuclease domain-containing protein [Nocardia alni]|uniref:relaxase/mobilization nuclease domain-containing protein n=1 Tax=Nocardia alni TaxID=2815723 RepID=UPI001C222B7C|nr:relaxase/mobilization nuclease domain-containing protein [Nocardia alni]
MAGLLAYVVGPGRSDEHTFPHLVAGDATITVDYPTGVELSHAGALAIARRLDRARRLFGTQVSVPNYLRESDGRIRLDAEGRKLKDPARPMTRGDVWHCSLSLRVSEGQLTEAKWARIATGFMTKMGFTADGSGRSPARWAAVHHGQSAGGNDHIHIIATAVRDDGTKVDLWRDEKHSQRVAGELELEYGLEVLESRHTGLGERGLAPIELPTRTPERRTAEPARRRLERIVRACAVASRDEGEFVRRLRGEQLAVLPRYAHGDTSRTVGYAVADTSRTVGYAVADPALGGGRAVYYAGGRLARDLTLPALRLEWDTAPRTDAEARAEWRAAHRNRPVANTDGVETVRVSPAQIQRAAQDLQAWNRYLARIPLDDRDQWARAAARAAGVVAAWSLRTEPTPGPLAATARALARSAQRPAHTRWHKPAKTLTASGAALIMLQTRHRPAAASYQLVLVQLTRTAQALRDAHTALGDLHRAAELDHTLRTELAAVHARYTAGRDRQLSPQMQRIVEGVREFSNGTIPGEHHLQAQQPSSVDISQPPRDREQDLRRPGDDPELER